ncbi:MAG: acetyl-CoA carboxylase biotin carboxyl carrier protein [Eubacteriales bacterium]
MQLKELEGIVEVFSKNQLTHLEVTEGALHICLKKEDHVVSSSVTPVAAPTTHIAPTTEVKAITQNEANGTPIKAPMVGIFYASKSPEAPAFVSVGSKVEQGDVIGLIEAMKMMNEITAPTSGVITSILAENEALVAYDDTLFTIEESAYVS